MLLTVIFELSKRPLPPFTKGRCLSHVSGTRDMCFGCATVIVENHDRRELGRDKGRAQYGDPEPHCGLRLAI